MFMLWCCFKELKNGMYVNNNPIFKCIKDIDGREYKAAKRRGKKKVWKEWKVKGKTLPCQKWKAKSQLEILQFFSSPELKSPVCSHVGNAVKARPQKSMLLLCGTKEAAMPQLALFFGQKVLLALQLCNPNIYWFIFKCSISLYYSDL